MSEELIEGTIDINGEPVDQATVKVVEQDTDDVYIAETDEYGNYSVDVDRGGEYHVFARYEDSEGNLYSGQSKPYSTVEYAIPDSGADHFWPANEGSGTIQNDNNGDEDLTGSWSWATDSGIGDVYADYDGTDDFANNDSGNWNQTTFTATAWVYPEGQGDGFQRIYGGYTDGGTYRWNIVFDRDGENRLHAFLDDVDYGVNVDLGRNAGDQIDTPEWYFVALVVDGGDGSARWYEAEVGDSSISEVDSSNDVNDTNPLTDVTQLTVGAQPDDTAHFEGGVDGAEYWIDEARSEAELDNWFSDTKENYQ